MPITFNDGIELAAPRYLDMRQGKIVGGQSVPFDSTSEALSSTVVTRRAVGLILMVVNGSIIEDWQFIGGTADGNLVLKGYGGGGGGGSTPYVLEVVIGSSDAITAGLLDGDTSYSNSSLVNKYIAIILDGLPLYGIDPLTGGVYYTKVYSSDTINFSSAVSNGSVIKIYTL